jgi:hypothetical protein
MQTGFAITARGLAPKLLAHLAGALSSYEEEAPRAGGPRGDAE